MTGLFRAETPPPWEVTTSPVPRLYLAVEGCFALPHFHRTLKVYQIYAKRPPEEVHTLLRALGADYVILEDSICYERRHQRGCRLRDLLDVANGHVSMWSPRGGLQLAS